MADPSHAGHLIPQGSFLTRWGKQFLKNSPPEVVALIVFWKLFTNWKHRCVFSIRTVKWQLGSRNEQNRKLSGFKGWKRQLTGPMCYPWVIPINPSAGKKGPKFWNSALTWFIFAHSLCDRERIFSMSMGWSDRSQLISIKQAYQNFTPTCWWAFCEVHHVRWFGYSEWKDTSINLGLDLALKICWAVCCLRNWF